MVVIYLVATIVVFFFLGVIVAIGRAHRTKRQGATMNLSDFWRRLARPSREVSPEEREKQLAKKAEELEKLAQHCETEAGLRKRIASAEKRIKATKPTGLASGFGGGRSGLVKAIAVVTIAVIIILVIVSKAC